MLMFKLQRRGKKQQASFRLVVGEKRSKLNGKQVEDLGWYNPHTKAFSFMKDRIAYWFSHGAQSTASVHNLFVRAGVIRGKKISVHKISKTKQAAISEEAKKEITAQSAESTVASSVAP